jgi:hypothetical protein
MYPIIYSVMESTNLFAPTWSLVCLKATTYIFTLSWPVFCLSRRMVKWTIKHITDVHIIQATARLALDFGSKLTIISYCVLRWPCKLSNMGVMVQAISSKIELTLYIWQLLFHLEYIHHLYCSRLWRSL